MTELEEKTERVMRFAHGADLAGVLLSSQPGFAWLTGGRTNRIDGSREAGNGALLVRADGRRFVIANVIEMPRLLAEELAVREWEPIEYPWTDDHARPDTLFNLAMSVTGGRKKVGADTALPGATFIDRELTRLRTPLVAAEVDRYRGLGRAAGEAIGTLCRSLRPGGTERVVARLVSDAAAAIGARAIVVLIAADERIARFRHPVPTDRGWQQRLLVAACIQREGLVVALSRIVCAGAGSDDLPARTRAAGSVFGALLDATRPGASGRDLFHTAQRAYAAAAFPGEEARHHQGGAIGYRSRDWIAHPASDEEVQAPQAFAWNPSITGTKVEDTVVLSETGVELITASPGWPLIDGRSADILQLE